MTENTSANKRALNSMVKEAKKHNKWSRDRLISLGKMMSDLGHDPKITMVALHYRTGEAITSLMAAVHQLREIEKKTGFHANAERRVSAEANQGVHKPVYILPKS